MLIGRKAEQTRLRDAFDSEYSEFVAVYGRRRVGKTFLVRETFGYSFTFSHTGLAKKNTRAQLENFRSSLRKQGLPKAAIPATWPEAFDMLEVLVEQSSDKRKVIFFDEIPWMDAPRSGFLMALEHFWNSWASARKDVLFIICGSATSWIINKVLHNHGGLHNRVTYSIALSPFTLRECEDYAKSLKLGMNRRQIMEGYMIMGGIPFYWSKLQRGLGLQQNIDELFFKESGLLHNEFDALYASLFDNPAPYMAIVTALGKKKIGMTRDELIESSGLKTNGMVTRYLRDLEHCGFIRRYNCFRKKSKDAMFQLMDNFTLFYFRFMQTGANDEHLWSKLSGTPVYNTWCALSFERVCLQHSRQIKAALGISGVITNEFSWRGAPSGGGGGTQIDLILDRADEVVDLCEIKYYKDLFSVDEKFLDDLEHKAEMFIRGSKTSKAVHYVLVTNKGVVRNANANEIHNVVVADDLFVE